MDWRLGWVLAAVSVAVGWRLYGWQGVLLAVTVTVFWLLLQFSRAMRAMKNAGQAPVGTVPSAVMLNARLQRGMTMLKVIALTRSLGTQVAGVRPHAAAPGNDAGDDVWRWADAGGSHVTLTFGAGRLQRWTLWRPAPSAAEPAVRQPAGPDARP